MKNLRLIAPLLASLLIVPGAAAQHGDGPGPNDHGREEIAAARARYLRTADLKPSTQDRTTLGQVPRRGTPMPIPPRHGSYPGSYSTPWMGEGNAGHALIGAGIGFGIGATVGALGAVHNRTSVGNGVIGGGSLLGLIGWAIGATHGGSHHFVHRRRSYPSSWPEGDEDGNVHSPSKTDEAQPEPTISANSVVPGQLPSVEARVACSPDMPTVPEQPSPIGTLLTFGYTTLPHGIRGGWGHRMEDLDRKR